MGFFDKLVGGGDAVISGDAFFFMDDDKRKLQICQEAGQRMAPAIGGSVKIRDGGDEVHVTGQYGTYPVRIIIWVTFANLRVQVRPPRGKLPVPTFTDFSLKYDDEAAEHAGEQLDRDAWDDDEEQKLFLSPHVFMEGDKEELRRIKTMYDQLPGQLMAGVLELLERPKKGGSHFSIREDELEWYTPDSESR